MHDRGRRAQRARDADRRADVEHDRDALPAAPSLSSSHARQQAEERAGSRVAGEQQRPRVNNNGRAARRDTTTVRRGRHSDADIGGVCNEMAVTTSPRARRPDARDRRIVWYHILRRHNSFDRAALPPTTTPTTTATTATTTTQQAAATPTTTTTATPTTTTASTRQHAEQDALLDHVLGRDRVGVVAVVGVCDPIAGRARGVARTRTRTAAFTTCPTEMAAHQAGERPTTTTTTKPNRNNSALERRREGERRRRAARRTGTRRRG